MTSLLAASTSARARFFDDLTTTGFAVFDSDRVLSDGELLGLAATVGEPFEHHGKPLVRAETVNSGDPDGAGLHFHNEGALCSPPPHFLFLHCVERRAHSGGETLVCPFDRVLDELPDGRRLATRVRGRVMGGIHGGTGHALPDAGVPYQLVRRDLASGDFLQHAGYFERVARHTPGELELVIADPDQRDFLDRFDRALAESSDRVSWDVGRVLAIDNTRCVHGRAPMTGAGGRTLKRVICGPMT